MLCERFGWTPSQILEQDPRIIDGLFIIMQAKSEAEEKKERKENGSKSNRRTYISKDGG